MKAMEQRDGDGWQDGDGCCDGQWRWMSCRMVMEGLRTA